MNTLEWGFNFRQIKIVPRYPKDISIKFLNKAQPQISSAPLLQKTASVLTLQPVTDLMPSRKAHGATWVKLVQAPLGFKSENKIPENTRILPAALSHVLLWRQLLCLSHAEAGSRGVHCHHEDTLLQKACPHLPLYHYFIDDHDSELLLSSYNGEVNSCELGADVGSGCRLPLGGGMNLVISTVSCRSCA